MNKVCLITGGTSGIGLQTARQMCRAGFCVYEMSRRATGQDGIPHLIGDVTDETAVRRAVDTILKAEHHLDVVINNVGFGISGAVEFTDTADARKQMDVNFFGMVTVNRVLLPIFRKQGYGRIITVSSVAAFIAIPFQAYYSASKAAINAYTLALANEVRPFGISVCAVQPGDIRTNFTAARKKELAGDGIYGGRISRGVAVMERDEQNGMDPAVVARFLCRVAQCRQIRPLYTIGWQYRLVALLNKLLPVSLVNLLVGRLYG